MRHGIAFFLALAASPFCAAASLDLSKEDLRSAEAVFRQKTPSLDWFTARGKAAISSTKSLLLAEGALKGGSASYAGLFVVSGPSNQILSAIDIFPERDADGSPQIDRPRPESVSLHFYGDYGQYYGSNIYYYDASGRRPAVKFRYAMLALEHSSVSGDVLRYDGRALEQLTRIRIEPRSVEEPPSFSIREIAAPRSGSLSAVNAANTRGRFADNREKARRR